MFSVVVFFNMLGVITLNGIMLSVVHAACRCFIRVGSGLTHKH